jgi:hypothetical protein
MPQGNDIWAGLVGFGHHAQDLVAGAVGDDAADKEQPSVRRLVGRIGRDIRIDEGGAEANAAGGARSAMDGAATFTTPISILTMNYTATRSGIVVQRWVEAASLIKPAHER